MNFGLIKISLMMSLGLLLAFPSLAQKSKTTSAIFAYKDYVDNDEKMSEDAKASLIEAKNLIDEAYNYSSDRWTGSKDAKTLFYKGEIYTAFMNYLMDPGMNDKFELEKLIQEGLEAYQAHIELPDKRNKDDESKTIIQKMAVLRAAAVNLAGNMYNNQNYEKAMQGYMSGIELYKVAGLTDTLSYFNAGLCASLTEKWDTAAMFFKVAAENDFGGALSYSKWADALFKQDKPDEAIAVLEKGRAKYPKDPDLYITEGNYWLLKAGDINVEMTNLKKDTSITDDEKAARISKLKEEKMNSQDKATTALQKAIDADPNNETVYYAVGALQSELGDYENAEKNMVKALELKPDYFDALYGMGALYYNQAVAQNEKVQDIADNKLYEEAKTKRDELFKKAIPYLNKAKEVNPNDRPTLNSLYKAYLILGMNEEAKEVRDLLSN